MSINKAYKGIVFTMVNISNETSKDTHLQPIKSLGNQKVKVFGAKDIGIPTAQTKKHSQSMAAIAPFVLDHSNLPTNHRLQRASSNKFSGSFFAIQDEAIMPTSHYMSATSSLYQTPRARNESHSTVINTGSSSTQKGDRSYQSPNIQLEVPRLPKRKFHYNPRIHSEDKKGLRLLLKEKENKIKEVYNQNTEIRNQVHLCFDQKKSCSASDLQQCLAKKSYFADVLELLQVHFKEKIQSCHQEQETSPIECQDDYTEHQMNEISRIKDSPPHSLVKKQYRALRTPSAMNLIIDLKNLSSKSYDLQSLSRTADTTEHANTYYNNYGGNFSKEAMDSDSIQETSSAIVLSKTKSISPHQKKTALSSPLIKRRNYTIKHQLRVPSRRTADQVPKCDNEEELNVHDDSKSPISIKQHPSQTSSPRNTQSS